MATREKQKQMSLDCAGKRLDLDHPQVMGILNVTPDSFSDGGRWLQLDAALEQARRMVAEGAAIIDIGGESTRPGALPVDVEEELERVIPVIRRLASELPVPISIDTSKPAVMAAAVEAGAGMINDVYGLRAPGALETAAAAGVPVCIMHMQGEPRTMQAQPHYADVVEEVAAFLRSRVEACVAAGIPREKVLVDPGFGFGKNLDHNIALLKRLDRLCGLGGGLLVGLSRKSMLGQLCGVASAAERLHGSVAATVLAALGGANVIRAHDVGPTVQALKVVAAIRPPELPG